MLRLALRVGQLFLHLLLQSGYYRCCLVHLVLAFDCSCGVQTVCVGLVLCLGFVHFVHFVHLVLLAPCPTLNVFCVAAPAYGTCIGIVSCCIGGTDPVICVGGRVLLFIDMAAICCTSAA